MCNVALFVYFAVASAISPPGARKYLQLTEPLWAYETRHVIALDAEHISRQPGSFSCDKRAHLASKPTGLSGGVYGVGSNTEDEGYVRLTANSSSPSSMRSDPECYFPLHLTRVSEPAIVFGSWAGGPAGRQVAPSQVRAIPALN